MMNKKALRADFILLFTAGIWGFGFVAQRSGMEYIGPFAFNGIRFILGSLWLLPLIFIRRKRNSVKPVSLQFLLLPSIAAGGLLFIGVILQQFGLMFTTVGNAGFITGLYVVLTPIFGIFLNRKTGIATWIGSALTFLGLYFLSAAGSSSINPGDILVLISTLFWASHVLLIDYLMQRGKLKIDPVELSAGQFAICGFLSLSCAFLIEPYIGDIIQRIKPSLLEAGLFACLPFPELISSVRAGII
jgi:drug/metabolite transporter (DMT)-like permease